MQYGWFFDAVSWKHPMFFVTVKAPGAEFDVDVDGTRKPLAARRRVEEH